MERDDLRWACKEICCRDGDSNDPVSDADLASLGYVRLADGAQEIWERWAETWAEKHGYVRLDGIDVEALREAVRKDPEAYPANGPIYDLAYAYLDALAAIDQEGA